MDIAKDFWKEYMKADEFKRLKIVKKLAPMFSGLLDIKKKELREHAIGSLLKNYFDDLIDVVGEAK